MLLLFICAHRIYPHGQIQRSIQSLRDSQETLSVTLNSIGEAVIATDVQARVTLLNPVA